MVVQLNQLSQWFRENATFIPCLVPFREVFQDDLLIFLYPQVTEFVSQVQI